MESKLDSATGAQNLTLRLELEAQKKSVGHRRLFAFDQPCEASNLGANAF